MLDVNFIVRTFLRWAAVTKQGPKATIAKNLSYNSVNSSAFTQIATTLCELLTELHGDLSVNSIELSAYSDHVARSSNNRVSDEDEDIRPRNDIVSSSNDLTLISSDNVKLTCKEHVLCRVPYFQSLLHGGFRESLQRDEQVRLDIHSSALYLVLAALESGTLPDLPAGRLLDTYTVLDYLQSDELLRAFDQQIRRIALRLTQTSLNDFLVELSPALMARTLPLLLQDMTDVFGMKGYAFVLRFLLRWLEVSGASFCCMSIAYVSGLVIEVAMFSIPIT